MQDYLVDFYKNVFFPELKKRNIKTILHGGDVFDRRKYINFVTLQKANDSFLDEIGNQEMEMHVILGNHDCFYKDTNEVNSVVQLLSTKKGITVYEEPTDLVFDGFRIMMLPWMNSKNKKEFMTRVNNSKSDYLLGHLELSGFDMHKGMPCEDGDDAKLFSKFEHVWTGHFHTQSEIGNVKYLGSPYEMTWIDYNDPKGFHIFDTETRTLEFVKNNNSMFHKIYYNDTMNSYSLNVEDWKYLKNKTIKIIVEDRKNHANFDALIDVINSVGPLNLTIVEDMKLVIEDADEDTAGIDKDTLTLIDEYIEDIQTDKDSIRLKKIMKNLYNEAQQ